MVTTSDMALQLCRCLQLSISSSYQATQRPRNQKSVVVRITEPTDPTGEQLVALPSLPGSQRADSLQGHAQPGQEVQVPRGATGMGQGHHHWHWFFPSLGPGLGG